MLSLKVVGKWIQNIIPRHLNLYKLILHVLSKKYLIFRRKKL